MKDFHPDMPAFITKSNEKQQHLSALSSFMQSSYTIGTWEMNDKLEANRFRDNISSWAKAQGYWTTDEAGKLHKTVIDVATKTIDNITYGQLIKLETEA